MRDGKKGLDAAIERQHVGLVVKLLHQQFRHCFEHNANAQGMDDISIVHGHILGFLARHAGEDVFQKDIEAEFRISRSTVTSIMQVMEKNELIERFPVAYDSRLKKVCLTPHGLEMHKLSVAVINETEKQTCRDLSAEELQKFFEIAKRIEQNLI